MARVRDFKNALVFGSHNDILFAVNIFRCQVCCYAVLVNIVVVTCRWFVRFFVGYLPLT